MLEGVSIIASTQPQPVRRPAPQQEWGAAAVELAFVLVPLLLLLFGIVEFGRAFSLQLRLSNAARDAARVVALYDPGAPPPSGGLTALVDQTLENTLGDDLFAGLSLKSVEYCPTDPSVTDDASVELEVAIQLHIPFSAVDELTLQASARMPCEQ